MDKERFLKLMMMTTSDADGEALNALRMANAMLKAEKKTWDDVLTQETVVNINLRQRTPTHYTQQKEEDWVAPHLRDKVMIDTMFRAIYAQPRTDNEEFWQFMDSVHHQWGQRERLTPGQYQAIRKCYNRVLRRA